MSEKIFDEESTPPLVRKILSAMDPRFYSVLNRHSLDGVIENHSRSALKPINYELIAQYCKKPNQAEAIKVYFSRKGIETNSGIYNLFQDKIKRSNRDWQESILDDQRIRDPLVARQMPDQFLVAVYSYMNELDIRLFNSPYRACELVPEKK